MGRKDHCCARRHTNLITPARASLGNPRLNRARPISGPLQDGLPRHCATDLARGREAIRSLGQVRQYAGANPDGERAAGSDCLDFKTGSGA